MLRKLSTAVPRQTPASIARLLAAPCVPVRGFQYAGVAAGIKPGTTKRDVFLVRSDTPCESAGVFTRNAVRAAPVAVCEQVLGMTGRGGLRFGKPGEGARERFREAGVGKAAPSAKPHTVFGNAGCANAVTGSAGRADAEEMSRLCSGPHAEAGLVMSTGVIGQRLPMDRIRRGYEKAEAELDGTAEALDRASRAMMTTDLIPKRSSASGVLPSTGKPFTVTGLAKGSGMIHINMGTMLSVIMTDAPATSEALEAALREVTEVTFNCVTVDGDTSTNDSAVILANGIALDNIDPASPAVITGPGHADFPALTAALAECCTDLARLLAYDGEGATKLITVHASGSASRADAHLLAQTVAASQLVKTAVHGGDANWGRILCAAGYSGAPLDPARVSCAMAAEGVGRVELLAAGEPVDIDETLATQIVAAGEVEVHFDAGLGGDGRATVWASDLTHGYIDINGSYRS